MLAIGRACDYVRLPDYPSIVSVEVRMLLGKVDVDVPIAPIALPTPGIYVSRGDLPVLRIYASSAGTPFLMASMMLALSEP